MADSVVVTGSHTFQATLDPIPAGKSVFFFYPGFTGIVVPTNRLIAVPAAAGGLFGTTLAQNRAAAAVNIGNRAAADNLGWSIVTGGSGAANDLAVTVDNYGGAPSAAGVVANVSQLHSETA